MILLVEEMLSEWLLSRTRAVYYDTIPDLKINLDKTLLLKHRTRDKLLRKLVDLKLNRNLQLSLYEKRYGSTFKDYTCNR